MSNSAQTFEQFRDTCRVCAKHSNKMVSLFGIRKKGLMLANMLGVCTQSKIQQTDRLPQNICNQCLSHLEIAFDFHTQVKSSELKFQNILSAGELRRESMRSEASVFINDVESPFKVELNVEINETFLDGFPQLLKRNQNVFAGTDACKSESSNQLEMNERKMRRLFECFLCKEKLKTFKDTRSHVKQHGEATPFKCKICSMQFSAAQIEQHLCKGQSVQCDYCSALFYTTQSLLNHLECHMDQHQLHKCAGCSRLFPMVYLLECHQHQHGTIEKPHICNFCGRGFRVKFLLTKHLTTHSDERPHLCSTCGMGFKTMGTLRSHTIRHSGIKPIACSKCPKRFFSKADLRKHMDVHSDAKYICNLCGSTLSSKRSLDEHRRHRHRKAEEQTCDLCSMKFRTIYNLKRHLLTHTGEKPHKCTYCDRAFAQSGDLNKHLRLHIGEKTYQCNLCYKSFRLQIELRKHSYEHFQNESESKITPEVSSA